MSVTIKRKILKIGVGMALSAVFFAFPNQAKAADAISVGTGQSANTDASAAMSASADSAVKALGSKKATIVLAWVDSGSEAAFSVLAAKFSGAKIYGFSARHATTQGGRDQKAALFAFTGQISASHTTAPHGTNYQTAGSQIGTTLKAVTTKTTDGKLIILAGDQNNPLDNQVTTGFLQTYGNNSAWITGGSTGKAFADGQIVSSAILGILLYGEFDCKFGFVQGSTVTPSLTALTNATDASKKPTLSIIFNCISRWESMGASGLTTEMNYFKQSLGTAPFLSAYGLGEIGKANLAATAYGTGGAISVANVYTRVSTAIAFENSPSISTQQIPSLTSSKSTAQYRINGTIAKSINAQPAGVIVTKEGAKNIKVNSQAVVK
jgi:hypothetical protein